MEKPGQERFQQGLSASCGPRTCGVSTPRCVRRMEVGWQYSWGEARVCQGPKEEGANPSQ